MFFPDSIFRLFTIIFTASLVRYFVIAGIAFWIYYKVLRKKIAYKKIQLKFPNSADYKREIFYSLLTFLIFGIVGVSLFNPIVRPYTQIYFKISDYGWFYLVFSFFMTLLIHDTYFYWMHRFMHHPKLFKYFHKVHHQSTNPSPWTSFSFQPLEGFVEAGIFVVFAFVLPLHPIIMLSFLVFMTSYNVYGHLGWEWLPKDGHKHWFWKWLNSSVMHNQHHHYFRNNYGLYFSFWDRMMGTLEKNYEKEFIQLKERTQRSDL